MSILSEALVALLGPERAREEVTDELLDDALRESLRRRQANSRDGGAVIEEMLRRGRSYRDIEREVGLAIGTAHRWRHRVGES